MKKLILALAAVTLLGTAAQAQKVNKEALLPEDRKERSCERRCEEGCESRYLAQSG